MNGVQERDQPNFNAHPEKQNWRCYQARTEPNTNSKSKSETVHFVEMWWAQRRVESVIWSVRVQPIIKLSKGRDIYVYYLCMYPIHTYVYPYVWRTLRQGQARAQAQSTLASPPTAVAARVSEANRANWGNGAACWEGKGEERGAREGEGGRCTLGFEVQVLLLWILQHFVYFVFRPCEFSKASGLKWGKANNNNNSTTAAATTTVEIPVQSRLD